MYLLFASKLAKVLTKLPNPLKEFLNPGAAAFKPLSIEEAIHPSGEMVWPIEKAKFLMAIAKPKMDGLDLNIEYVKLYSRSGYTIK